MNYTRQNPGRDADAGRKNSPHSSDGMNTAPSEEATIKVDGFEQVLEMLKIADPQFRESLLRRLAQRDPELARNLRADLGF